MYMFVMRYEPARCGGLPIEEFLRAVNAEGAPIHRCYSSTMSGQPAMQRLMIRRPEYVRACATPVADDAVGRSLYISADVFLGNEEDMKDVAASVRKVESHYSHRAA